MGFMAVRMSALGFVLLMDRCYGADRACRVSGCLGMLVVLAPCLNDFVFLRPLW